MSSEVSVEGARRRWPIRLAALAGVALAVSAGVVVFAARGDGLNTEEVSVPAPRGRILARDGEVLAEDRVVDGVTVRHRPNGTTAAHLLGYVRTEDGRRSGAGGVEQSADRELRGAPGRIVYEVDSDGRPIRERTDLRRQPVPGRDVTLALDLDLQVLVEAALAAAVTQGQGRVGPACEGDGTPGCQPEVGASVVVDPANGDVLALASYPTFDPAAVEGGDEDDYAAITGEERSDEHHFPLLNRVVGGAYPPGFTFAPFVAEAALDAEVIDIDERYYDGSGRYAFSADCDLTVPPEETDCYLQNPGATPTGDVDLRRALATPSHTYFYRAGDVAWRSRDSLGEDALQVRIGEWGLGARTGVDLPGEQPGRVPTPEWLADFSRRLNGDNEAAVEAGTWRSGTSADMAVGQGDVIATPIQMAQAYAALVDGGRVRRPRVVLRSAAADGGSARRTATQVESTVDADSEVESALPGGLSDAIATGPANGVFAGYDGLDCVARGLTGSSQVRGRDDTAMHALTLTEPSADASLTMFTVVEHGGSGAYGAAPVSRVVADSVAAADCDPRAVGPSVESVADRMAAVMAAAMPVD